MGYTSYESADSKSEGKKARKLSKNNVVSYYSVSKADTENQSNKCKKYHKQNICNQCNGFT